MTFLVTKEDESFWINKIKNESLDNYFVIPYGGYHNEKIVIIGSVAAGTSVAAKARRNSEDVEIIVLIKIMIFRIQYVVSPTI